MSNKIPTAKDFLEARHIEGSDKRCEALIEFAKLHVENALLAVLGVEVTGCGCMEADEIHSYAVELLDKYSEATELAELDTSAMVESGLETVVLVRKYSKSN